MADPFLCTENGTWFLFFEVFNEEASKGEIGLATSADGLQWQYRRIVLREPFHLSYPHVFRHRDGWRMIPETCQAGEVRLYRALEFPTTWELDHVLLRGRPFVDSTVFRHDGRWWLFTSTSRVGDTLSLYHAQDLAGPWEEHPRSPVVRRDTQRARPAGRVVLGEQGLIRYAQEVAPLYGTSVRAFRITRLTPTRYEERPAGRRPILEGSGAGWNALGMHHVDASRREDGVWIACVDGWTVEPRGEEGGDDG